MISFIVSRFLAGMAGQKVWQSLRSGAGVMVGSALILLLIAIATILRYFEIDGAVSIVAWIIPVFMCIVAAEVLLNLILQLYRPRIAGEFPRAAFDSRALSLLATPDSFIRSINDAVNYQFGFDITSSWGYQLVLRSGAWLCVLGIVVLLALSTLSVVEGREQGLRLRSGAIIDNGSEAVHNPGFFWKLPWPIETTEVYDVSSIRALALTPMERGERPGFLWEDELRLPPGAKLDPFIVGRSRLSDTSSAETETESEDSSGDLALVEMIIQLQYRIRPESDGEAGLLRYLHFGTDGMTFKSNLTVRDQALRALALSAITRQLGLLTLDDVLSNQRADLSSLLQSSIQKLFDEQQTGVELIAVGLPLVRPAGQAAGGFQDLPLAMQQRDRAVARAERSRTSVFTAVIGNPDLVKPIEASIDAVDAARIDRDRIYRETGEQSEESLKASQHLTKQIVATEELLFKAGGQASSIIDSAERDRWIDIMAKRAQADRVMSQVAAYQAAPELYRQRAIMQAYVRRLSNLRKYIVGIPPERMNVNVELRELASPNTIFEGVLTEEGSSP